jgi:hypothetical protein
MHKIYAELRGFIIYDFCTNVLNENENFYICSGVDAECTMLLNGEGSGCGNYDSSGKGNKYLYGDGVGYCSNGLGDSHERTSRLIFSTEEADA